MKEKSLNRSLFDGDKETIYNRLKTRKGEVFAMTLCIGALCDNKQAIVGVADRMLTSKRKDGSLGEHDGQTKIKEPTTYFAALCAGSANYFSDIDKRIRALYADRLDEESPKYDPPTIGEATSAYKKIIEDVIKEFGLKSGDIWVLVVGYDKEGCQINAVSDAHIAPCEDLGVAIIGIGVELAQEFIKAGGYDSYAMSLEETLLKVYLAKNRSATTGHVGEATDIIINIAGRGQRQIRENEDSDLRRLLDGYCKEIKENELAISRKYQQLLEEPLIKLFK